jgi:hypothetical protein
VSEDDCRKVVGELNDLRWIRSDYLGDGYDVGDILCYNIVVAPTETLPMQCLEELVYTPTMKDVLIKYMGGMMSVLLSLCGIFENLTRHAAQHAHSMATLQRVLRQK